MAEKQKRFACALLTAVLLLLLWAPAVDATEGEPVVLPVLSEGQRNIVKRARQMTDILWTPNEDVVGWKSEYTYRAGVTYRGLPYGQPVYADYVPWETDLLGFVRAVNTPDSKMYTAYSEYGGRAPYYSLDCSGFVSWAWGLSSRKTTRSLPEHATKISDRSYEDAQVGDCLCLSGVHTVLITDITYDENGTINGIEISEATTNLATDYCCQITRYGKDGEYTLNQLTTRYFGSGYILYRSKTRDSVTYTHSCAVPLEGDSCTACSREARTVTQESLWAVGDKQVTLYAQPRKNAVTVGSVGAGKETVVTGSWEDAQGLLWYQTWSGAWLPGEGVTVSCRHDYRSVETVDPTCKAPGKIRYVCSLCGEDKIQEIEKLDHSYQNGFCIWCHAEDTKVQLGDFTGDGLVTDEDVIHLLWYTVFPEDYPLNGPGDFTGDGNITDEDVIYLLWHTVFPEDYPLE